MEYDNSLQKGECDSQGSLKVLYPVEIDGSKDLSEAKLACFSVKDCLRISSAKKLPPTVELTKETLSLILKARDDLNREQGVSKVQDVVEYANQSADDSLGNRKSNKLVKIPLNNSTASASTITNVNGFKKQNKGKNFYFETAQKVDAIQVPFQVVAHSEHKPLKYNKWFQHDDRLHMEVEDTAAKFEGGKITTRSSREATNRWEHDLYDASKKYQDDFSGHPKHLVHSGPLSGGKEKLVNKQHETVDRWVHDMYDATEQTPKSDKEFIDHYGHERRQANSAQRYSRGPSQYRSSFEEHADSAHSRSFRGRGDSRRFQPRSEDQMRYVSISILQSSLLRKSSPKPLRNLRVQSSQRPTNNTIARVQIFALKRAIKLLVSSKTPGRLIIRQLMFRVFANTL